MSEDSKKREIGHSISPNYFELFKWKIPNASSIPHRVEYVLQSPSFSFGEASWVLKMYPYGQTKYETAGYIDVTIERLHSKHEFISFNCIMDCENTFKKEIVQIRGNYTFDSEWPQAKIMRFMQNLKECPEKCQITPNDTFTLVFGFESFVLDVIEDRRADLQIESGKAAVGKIYTASGRNESQEIGELIKVHSVLANFTWKVCMERHPDENGLYISFPFPKDYQVQSKPFNLDRASWIFKLYPYFLMERSSKQSYDVVLQRLHSEISEHHVMLKIKELSNVTERSFLFNSCKTIGDAISFQLPEENFRERKCLHFNVEIFIKKDLGIELNPMEIVKPAVDSPEQTSEQEPESPADNFRDLSKQTSEQESESSAITSTGSNSASNDPMALSCMKVLADLKDMFLKQENCDVIIKIKGQEFPSHKAILAARCLVFASTFKNDMKEKHTGVVEIEDCDASSFSDFLLFLYCGKVDNLTSENSFSLFTTADKYDVQDLRSQCLEFIKNNLSIRNLCNAVTLALQYSEDELLQLSIDFLAKNLQEVIMTVEWQELLIQNPIQCNELMIKALKSNQVKLNSNS